MDLERENSVKKIPQTSNRQLCPECGAYMKVVDCRRESGTLFIWYGCTRDSCSGRWQKKIGGTSPNNIKKAV